MQLAGLRADNELLQILLESVQDYAIFLLTPEGIISSWNKGAQHIKGYLPEEIIGQHFSKFYPPDVVARGWPDTELKLAAERGRFEDEGWRLRKDGSRFWANVVITALRGPDGELRGFAKITRDLTERVRQEQTLRESEERLHLLVDSVSDHAIFMLDPAGHVMSWNSGAQRLKGYRADEIIGQHFSRFYMPEATTQAWPQHELEVALEKGRFEDEGWRVRKDGTRFWANVVITPVRDGTGELRGFAKVTRDLTERSRLAAMQTSERHMDEFLAVLGHELRNPLGAISNAAVIINKLTDTKQNAQLERASQILGRQIGQVTRLVDDLLDVARIRQGKFPLRVERVDLRAVLEVAAESVPLIKLKEHNFSIEFGEGEFFLQGDRERLTQVFSNVLNNAAKYTQEGGAIGVTAQRRSDEFVVRIKDTGVGIESELLPHIFDMFRQGERSLDNAHGGLGIGLTLVQRILGLHHGSIEAYSHGRDQGSEFIIRLPISM